MGDQENARTLYGRPTIFVDAARPDDNGDGLTWATAKKTISGAVSTASNGYCLLIGPGTYTEKVNAAALSGLLILGTPGAHLTYGVNEQSNVLTLGSCATVDGLHVSYTGTQSTGETAVIRAENQSDILVRNCQVNSTRAGLGFKNCANVRVADCHVIAKEYGIWHRNTEACGLSRATWSLTVEDCHISLADWTSCAVNGIDAQSVLALIRNCHVYVQSSAGIGFPVVGINCSINGSVADATPRTTVIDNCVIEVVTSTAGGVCGVSFGGTGATYSGVVANTAIRTIPKAGGSDFHVSASPGSAICNNCLLDESKVYGNVTFLRPSGLPTTIATKLDVAVSGITGLNVDSTGGELTLAKALEVIVARCVGDLAYNSESGVVTFKGRDGETPVATVQLTGGGNRTQSTISD